MNYVYVDMNEEERCGTVKRKGDGWPVAVEDGLHAYEWNTADWMAEVEREQLWRAVKALGALVAK